MARMIEFRKGVKDPHLQEFMKNLLKKDILTDGSYNKLYDALLSIQIGEIIPEDIKDFIISVSGVICRSEMKGDSNYLVYIRFLKKHGFWDW